MGVGAGLYMYVVVVQKITFAISSPDEFLLWSPYVIGRTIIMAALWNRETSIFLPCGFYLSIFFYFLA